MDDRQEPKGAAEQAFDALRDEVAAVRRGIELIHRQMWQTGPADGPDYSLTLGEMQKTLQGLHERLTAIERSPAQMLTPMSFGEQINSVVSRAMAAASPPELSMAAANAAQSAAVLDGMIGRVRDRHEQRAWMLWAWFVGLPSGLVLWFLLIRFLPGGAGDWLASLPLAGDRWQAGEVLLQRVRPAEFDRMTQLNLACGVLTTERCVTGLSALATPPPPPPAQPPEQPTAPTVFVPAVPPPKASHGRQ
jgi:hypothetical protein